MSTCAGLALDHEIRPREAEVGGDPRDPPPTSQGTLKDFVGLSFEYARPHAMGYGCTEPGPAAIVSTIKLMQAGFTEVMDTEN